MDRRGGRRLPPAVWTLIVLIVVIATFAVTAGLFTGRFTRHVPITIASERSGLVMETGAKVRMRGVQVGRVAGIEPGGRVRLHVELFPDQVPMIPRNVSAEIRSTTAFGAKFVELIVPEDIVAGPHIEAGAVVLSRNVTTEVNTVFQNLVDVLHTVEPAKLNATLSAVAEGLRGQGRRIGEATSAANAVLGELNPRMGQARDDWVSLQRFADAYTGAADDILTVLDASTVLGQSVVDHAGDLDALLLELTGLARSGIGLLAPNQQNLIDAVNGLAPTTALLQAYSPTYTCMLLGAKWYLDHGGREQVGGNGRTIVLDSAINLGDDPYRYPENLPVVAAKGGPGGRPSCGSLPDVSKQFPVRQLITNTGWGTGIDIRPNPGIGHPWWLNLFPITRAVPEAPSLHGQGPPAIGPVPYPGAPPYEPPGGGPP